jgi:hypothetical protein
MLLHLLQLQERGELENHSYFLQHALELGLLLAKKYHQHHQLPHLLNLH